MKIYTNYYLIALILLAGTLALSGQNNSAKRVDPAEPMQEVQVEEEPKITETSPPDEPIEKPEIKAPNSHEISLPNYYKQTFNNCGPATLAMVLNYYGIDTNQGELGQSLRPYQHPTGNNDDKSVNLTELAYEAKQLGFAAYHKPNGDFEKLKKFLASDIPVITRTWLHKDDYIGHYRVIRGYNDTTKQILQDDSYEGEDIYYSYNDFLNLWEAFNYEYLVVVEKDKVEIAEAILGEDLDERTAWENAVKRIESEGNRNSPFYGLNLSVAYYHLGNYEKSIEMYESVEGQLPFRTLWYQLEPIQAYAKAGEHSRVLSLSNSILNNHNRAYSELYYIRGKVLEEMGRDTEAETEFAKAIQYNKNFDPAKSGLN